MTSHNSEKLAVFLHRAKGSAEAAARAVNQALDDAELFVFGELLELETVKAVSPAEYWRVESIACIPLLRCAARKRRSCSFFQAIGAACLWYIEGFQVQSKSIW